MVRSPDMCSLDKGCKCWLIFLRVLLSCWQLQYFVNLFLAPTDEVILELNSYRGGNRETCERRQTTNGENWANSSSFYGVLLAPVVFEEDFSFSFGSNISLLFLLWKWALKQECSFRQGLVSSGDTCRETARKTSFWFLYLLSYSLPCECLQHRSTASWGFPSPVLRCEPEW